MKFGKLMMLLPWIKALMMEGPTKGIENKIPRKLDLITLSFFKPILVKLCFLTFIEIIIVLVFVIITED